MATERTEFGVVRTECACKACMVNCHFVPGSLIPTDLNQIAEYLNESDLTRFAFDNLLASPGAIIYRRSSCSRKRLFSASSFSIRSFNGAIRIWISSDVYFGVMCCEQFQSNASICRIIARPMRVW